MVRFEACVRLMKDVENQSRVFHQVASLRLMQRDHGPSPFSKETGSPDAENLKHSRLKLAFAACTAGLALNGINMKELEQLAVTVHTREREKEEKKALRGSLMNLPVELLVSIFGRLKPSQLLSVVCCCKTLSELTIEHVSPPWSNNGRGLLWACWNGYEDYYVKWSKVAGDRWNPSSENNLALKWALGQGFMSLVGILVKDARVKPGHDILTKAVDSHRADIVRVILNDVRVDPTLQDNYVLLMLSYLASKK